MRSSAIVLISSCLAQLQLYEPANGVYFGPWFNRIDGVTPNSLQQVFNYNKMSVFQSDINITATSIQSDSLDDIVQKVQDTKSDAILYLTIYSFAPATTITNTTWDLLATKLKAIRKTGRRVILRAFSEMNGNWFAYGQQPSTFVEIWRNMVTRIRSQVEGVAFCWAPNSADGYPFPGGQYGPPANNTADFRLMDTNNDGKVDKNDDPYSPFYPGDEYVDWVGFSIYHYGAQWPWNQNVLPVPNQVEDVLTGKWGSSGPFDFYQMFSSPTGSGSSKGNKPFMITETSATIHISNSSGPISNPLGSLAIKQTWWRQLFNATFLGLYPKIKLICLFEFKKFEETTLRDFRMLMTDEGLAPAFSSDLQNLSAGVLIYGNTTADKITNGPSGSQSLVVSLFCGVLMVGVYLVI